MAKKKTDTVTPATTTATESPFKPNWTVLPSATKNNQLTASWANNFVKNLQKESVTIDGKDVNALKYLKNQTGIGDDKVLSSLITKMPIETTEKYVKNLNSADDVIKGVKGLSTKTKVGTAAKTAAKNLKSNIIWNLGMDLVFSVPEIMAASPEERGEKIVDTVGGSIAGAAGYSAGAAGAAALGAAIGTAFGPVGTLVGGTAGQIIGGLLGSTAGRSIWDKYVKPMFGLGSDTNDAQAAAAIEAQIASGEADPTAVSRMAQLQQYFTQQAQTIQQQQLERQQTSSSGRVANLRNVYSAGGGINSDTILSAWPVEARREIVQAFSPAPQKNSGQGVSEQEIRKMVREEYQKAYNSKKSPKKTTKKEAKQEVKKSTKKKTSPRQASTQFFRAPKKSIR